MGPRAFRRFATAIAALATISVVAVGCLPAAPPPATLGIATDPALFPSFSTSVPDYVSRCGSSTPVNVSIQAPADTTLSVADQPAASGTFSASVTRAVGQSFTIVVTTPAGPSTYHVRCIPADFPTWTTSAAWVKQQSEFYTLAGGVAKYAAIVDTNGVPVWWDVPPAPTVFSQLLPDGNYGWITLDGTTQEVPLDGSAPHTVTGPGDSTSATDYHDLVQMPNGHHVIVVNKFVPNVDLSVWGPSFTTGTIIDHVITELDANGAAVWTWDLMSHIPIAQTNPQWRSTQSACPSGLCFDPYHWNSIEPVVEANGAPGYVLSSRPLDAVYNIDRADDAIGWRLGGEPRRSTSAVGVASGGASITASDASFTNADLGATVSDSHGVVVAGTRITGVTSPTTATISQPTTGATTGDVFTINPESLAILGDAVFQSGGHFGGQHDARSSGDGTFTLFDNGSGLGRAPRAVRYRIDATAGTATLMEQFRDTNLTPNSICCGSARRLAGGNWVIGWGGSTTFSEMTARGSRMFSVQQSTGPIVYRAFPVPPGTLDRATLRADMDANTSLANDVAASSSPPSSDIIP